MSTNNLTQLNATPVITNQHIDQYFNALENDFVPRNSGAPTASGGRIGTPTYPWAAGYFSGNVYVDGVPLGGGTDTGLFTDTSNYILSSSVDDYNTPNFIVPNGSNNTATILATDVNLEVVINGASVIFENDVSLTGLTSAPSSNNTCLVNHPSTTGVTQTKYQRDIAIDNIGTEISGRNGKVCGFLQNSEYFLAYVDTTNGYLRVLRRGAFLNSSGAAISRATIADNATITLMSTAWVFAEDTGTSVVVTYNSPVYSGTAPSSPSTGDYWYDLTEKAWKVWSGSAWSDADRTLIGVVLINSSGAAVAGLGFNPAVDAADINTFKLAKLDSSKVVSINPQNHISVYGSYFYFGTPLVWDISQHLDTGLTEAASTMYYLYLTHEGKPIISDEFPEFRPELSGYYHPYKTYRWVGSVRNDSSSNFRPEVNNAATVFGSVDLVMDYKIIGTNADIQIFDFNNIYDKYIVEFISVENSTSPTSPTMVMSVDNGTNYITSTDYEHNIFGYTSGSNTAIAQASFVSGHTSYIDLLSAVNYYYDGTTNAALDLKIELFNPANLRYNVGKQMLISGVAYKNGVGLFGFMGGATNYTNTSLIRNPVNAVKIATGGGNWLRGRVKVYGYKRT